MTILEQPLDPNDDLDIEEYQDEADRERIEHQRFLRDVVYDRETGIPRFGEI